MKQDPKLMERYDDAFMEQRESGTIEGYEELSSPE